jgi:hypothetical protein
MQVVSQKPLAPQLGIPPQQTLPTVMGKPSHASDIAFQEYYETLIRLEGRFLEKKEFVDRLAGAQVTWDGYVDSVIEMNDGEMALIIRTSKKSRFFGEDFWQAIVLFDKSWKSKLFSLRRLDRVRVIGVVRQAGGILNLEGASVELNPDETKNSSRGTTKHAKPSE